MDKYTIKNVRQIKVKFLPATNHKSHRIILWEQQPAHNVPTKRKVFSFDTDINDVVDQALAILKHNGFTPVCRACELEYHVILCDDFGDNFVSINDLKDFAIC